MFTRRAFLKETITTILLGCKEREIDRIEAKAEFKHEMIEMESISFLSPVVNPKKREDFLRNLEIFRTLNPHSRLDFGRFFCCHKVDNDLELKYNYTLFKPMFKDVAKFFKLNDWIILSKIALMESYMSPKRVNRKSGARGLMQIMPFHFKDFGLLEFKDFDPLDPLYNLMVGAKVYKTELRRTGNTRDALEAYNCGYSSFREKKRDGDLRYNYASSILFAKLNDKL